MNGRVIGTYVDKTYFIFLVNPGRRTLLMSGNNESFWKPASISKRQRIRYLSSGKIYLQLTFVPAASTVKATVKAVLLRLRSKKLGFCLFPPVSDLLQAPKPE